MVIGRWRPVRRELYRLAGGADWGALADATLLALYVEARQAEAFAEIVRRHGPRVWGVCRRGLCQSADAEDAFQATFLVLARRAGSVRRRGSLASWLHGVALRVVGKAHRAAARRRSLPLGPDDRPTSDDPPADAARHEASDIIDAELARLPEKYRAPLLLCYYDGHTNTTAARALGWPAGTVSVRLARARALLRDRLARRGLALSVTCLAPAVPAALQESAVGHAQLVLSGPPVRAAGSAVVLLANQVVRTMTVLHWMKIVAAAGLVVGLTALAFGMTPAARAPVRQEEPPAATAAPPPAGAVSDEEIAQLRARLRELYRQRNKLGRSMIEADLRLRGTGSRRQFLETEFGTVRLELESCETPAERVAVLEKLVGLAREMEVMDDRIRKVGGGGSPRGWLETRFVRITTEIDLVRARMKLPGTDQPALQARLAELRREFAKTVQDLLDLDQALAMRTATSRRSLLETEFGVAQAELAMTDDPAEKRRLLGRMVESAREIERMEKNLQEAGATSSRRTVLEAQTRRVNAEIVRENLPGGDPQRLRQAFKEHAEICRKFLELDESLLTGPARPQTSERIQEDLLWVREAEMRLAETPATLRELYGQARQYLAALERITRALADAGRIPQRARDEDTLGQINREIVLVRLMIDRLTALRGK